MEVRNVSTSATSTVGNVRISYTVTERGGKKEMSGIAYNADEEVVCHLNWKKDGGLGISFTADSFSFAEQKAVTEQILADIEQLNAE